MARTRGSKASQMSRKRKNLGTTEASVEASVPLQNLQISEQELAISCPPVEEGTSNRGIIISRLINKGNL